MFICILFLVLLLSASVPLTGKPETPCAPPAGLVPIGTTTINLVKAASGGSDVSFILKILTYRTSTPGPLPASSLWYDKSNENKAVHYLVHVAYIVVDYVNPSDRETSRERDRCLKHPPMGLKSCS
jgi:hypothetical protein